MDQLTITYLGQQITYSADFCLAVATKNRYQIYADTAAKLFVEKYYDKYGNFNVFVNNYLQDIANILKPCYHVMAEELLQYGIYDTSEEQVLQEYGDFLLSDVFETRNAITEICDTSNDIIEAQRQLRKQRKAGRARLVGGGFGITGALKGIAVAGAYNTMSGLLHSGANAIGNSATMLKHQKELQKLYHSQELRNQMMSCVQSSVERIGFVVTHILGVADAYPTEEQKSKARVLQGNLPRIPEESRPEIIAQILSVLPDDMDTYRLLLPLYGDFEGGLRATVEEVTPSNLAEFDDLRKDIFTKSNEPIYLEIDEKIEKFSAGEFIGEQQTILQNSVKKCIIENGKKLGYTTTEDIVADAVKAATEYIHKICAQKDIKSRTVSGVTYSSYDLAQKAMQNRESSEHMWQYAMTQNYSELCETLKKFREINQEPPQGSIADFVEKAVQKETKFRTVNDVVYETYELAKKAEKNRLAAAQILRQCTSESSTVLLDMLQKVNLLNQEIPVGAVSDYVDKISEIEVTSRTVNGIVYTSFELAEEAKSNRDSAEKLLNACDTMDNIDMCWVLQRLQGINHTEPVGAISDCIDKMLTNHFGRTDTNEYAFSGVIFPSVIERQDTECEFWLLIRKHIKGALTQQGLVALKEELGGISDTTPLYKLVSSYIDNGEEALRQQQAREAAKNEQKQKQQAAEKNNRFKAALALFFGVAFIYTGLNAPFISIYGIPCTFSEIMDVGINGDGVAAILALLCGTFGLGVIAGIVKAAASLLTKQANQGEVFACSFWVCLFIVAFAIFGGDHFDCEGRAFIWIAASLIGYTYCYF